MMISENVTPAAEPDYPEIVRIARDLIRMDTSRHEVICDDGDSSRHVCEIETPAARYVMSLLEEVGYRPQWIEPVSGRPNIVVRVPGKDRSRPGLILHGHLDVVPADPTEWEHDPFGGEIIDGVLWGRGAVDMKDMIAMMVMLLRDMAICSWAPPRDLVVCFFADEEGGGWEGAQLLVRDYPELFEGCTQAVSEVGGYPTYIQGKRVYLIQTAEKGQIWYRLHARGAAGHGSLDNAENAVTKLSCALAALGMEEWPTTLTPTVRTLLANVAQIARIPFDESSPESLAAVLDTLGTAKAFVQATTHTTANPTQASGGYKVNVVPGSAEGSVDIRFLPGEEESVKQRVKELVGDVSLEPLLDVPAIEAPARGSLVEAMEQAIHEADPEAIVLPYMLSAGTDNKHLSQLGIDGYGFVPVNLPEDFDFPSMFHAANERIPVQSLIDGFSVLRRFIQLS
ncbi:MAG: M20/M25/M40 family metallo-hydrolase [Actinomycetaceae bacterium]|nr:M20/M25/M40 family metallo-hydrolase [Arcanobacterium sp.]MDD7686545.1 M20/M25/M40 family metallo-hydrolase [Actinomycetaceae bacterium]MDY5272825.1 M20/M25/M40 family metallo-hydrolase [Arcanobacterium sp.]